MDCEQFFCKACELSHLKGKPCRNHVFQDAVNANAEVKTPICRQHQEKFTFYCNTCTSLICNIRLPITHKKHDFSLIDDAASKTRPRLDVEVNSAEGRISRAKQQIISSRLTLKNFEDETDKIKRNIVGRVVLIINALDATKATYLKSVEEHIIKEIQKMNQEIMKFEKETENGVEVLDKMKSSIDGKNNIVLMDAVSKLTNTLKSVSLVSAVEYEQYHEPVVSEGLDESIHEQYPEPVVLEGLDEHIHEQYTELVVLECLDEPTHEQYTDPVVSEGLDEVIHAQYPEPTVSECLDEPIHEQYPEKVVSECLDEVKHE
ncbi:Hypothetical predicted protein [Mytilus galloprovincialis]|uniref:B box-type domain-containing protein n=1 Tax=Mytilus galloprovincialis TaxID=29158 RepID=A0A8B6BSB0_MYTGA|nr:Hypothetical predicted protein [Mytilus galloprovincialis]